MRVSGLVLVLAVVSAFAFGTSVNNWQSFGGQPDAEPQVTVIESDNLHLVVDIAIPGFWLSSYPAGGQIWDRIQLPGHSPQGEVGYAELPSVANLFALPYGTEAVITIENVEYSEFGNLTVLPRQTPDIDMPHSPYPFRIDDGAYSLDGPSPSTWAVMDNDGSWAGLRVSRLLVTPFRFNAATNELLAASQIRVRIDFTGTPEAISYPVHEGAASVMASQVINWAAFREAAVTDGRAGTEYIFIVNSSTYPAVQELIEMHHALGLQSKVVTVSDPTTASAIKTAITNNYEAGVTRFALIVGDGTEMPPYTGYSGVTYSDYYFTLLTGGDNYPELAVGRLTGTPAQITHQVDKIMNGYVFYGFDDGNTTGVIPSTTVLAAHQEQYPNKYTLCCNQIAAYSYGLTDMTFYKIYPPEGGTNAMVTSWFNTGIGTVGYRGHGNVTIWSWSAPTSWTVALTNALTNTFMPPVFNIACYCGSFVPSGVCLAEAFQWAVGGSSGNVSAYNPSYTIPNHDYMKQLYIALYDTGIFRVQEAINAATVYIINNHGGIGLTNARMYFWFGDPAMDIYTFDEPSEPEFLTCNAPASVAPGSQTITITVTADGTPLAGATVALSDGVEGAPADMTFYEEGTTNGSGQVSFNVTVPSTGELLVGAFKHDYVPDTGVILITVGVEDGGDFAIASDLSLGSPVPNPIAASAAISFSVPSVGQTELAVFDVMGRRVETIVDGVIIAGAHNVSWMPGNQIANGVYFIRLTTAEGTVTRQVMVIR
jgi:hypothetical protein